MQIKTLKLNLKVVVRETGSAQGDIYSTFQEEQVIDRTQCMLVRLNFHKVTSLNDQSNFKACI